MLIIALDWYYLDCYVTKPQAATGRTHTFLPPHLCQAQGVCQATAMNALVLARRRRAGGPSHPVGAAPHATACMETDRNDAGDRAFGFAVEK